MQTERRRERFAAGVLIKAKNKKKKKKKKKIAGTGN